MTTMTKQLQEFEVKSPKNLDTIEATWRKLPVRPLTEVGQFDPNGCHSVTRVSRTELRILTTGNVELVFTCQA